MPCNSWVHTSVLCNLLQNKIVPTFNIWWGEKEKKKSFFFFQMHLLHHLKLVVSVSLSWMRKVINSRDLCQYLDITAFQMCCGSGFCHIAICFVYSPWCLTPSGSPCKGMAMAKESPAFSVQRLPLCLFKPSPLPVSLINVFPHLIPLSPKWLASHSHFQSHSDTPFSQTCHSSSSQCDQPILGCFFSPICVVSGEQYDFVYSMWMKLSEWLLKLDTTNESMYQ